MVLFRLRYSLSKISLKHVKMLNLGAINREIMANHAFGWISAS